MCICVYVHTTHVYVYKCIHVYVYISKYTSKLLSEPFISTCHHSCVINNQHNKVNYCHDYHHNLYIQKHAKHIKAKWRLHYK